jgi:hypothetical protein
VPPDLTGARETARSELVDACTITRDAQGYGDDTIDPDTLEFTPPAGDDDGVYSGGCLIGPQSVTVQEIGGEYVQIARRVVRLPFDAAVPKPGDKLVVTASAGNPHLIDKPFRVVDVEDRSIFVTRILTVEHVAVTP